MIQVLIVEDDPMVGEINRRYVDALDGFSCVKVATRTLEAWNTMKQHPIDLVLLDVFLPEQNGLQFLTEIRRESHSVDVIVITAASDNHSVKTALRLGAVDYLIKPFEFERFRVAMQAYQADHSLFGAKGTVSQRELDALLFHQSDSLPLQELPKGLSHETLARTVEHIQALPGNPFATKTLADMVGISRVSMKKYLSFLEKIHFLQSTLDYHSVGRPVAMYRIRDGHEDAIAPYLQT
jgi:CitB family two-component system response regulator MalR